MSEYVCIEKARKINTKIFTFVFLLYLFLYVRSFTTIVYYLSNQKKLMTYINVSGINDKGSFYKVSHESVPTDKSPAPPLVLIQIIPHLRHCICLPN